LYERRSEFYGLIIKLCGLTLIMLVTLVIAPNESLILTIIISYYDALPFVPLPVGNRVLSELS